MRCAGCTSFLTDEARFCPTCGAKVPDEDPAAVAEYGRALRTLAGRTEAWAEAELARTREELGIRRATHERLLAALRPAPVPASAWIDAHTIADFRAGEAAMVRLRVVNEGESPFAAVKLRATCTAHDGHLEAQGSRALGPGEDEVLAMRILPAVAGHHALTGTLRVEVFRGPVLHLRLGEVAFLVGQAAALQQSIHIDARSQRVGIFENIGVAARGGLVARADWRRVDLSPADAPVEAAPAPTTLPVGHRAVGTVVATNPLTVEVDGRRGPLVELEDPGLRAVLRPGDRLEVSVLGADADRPLFSTRRADRPAARAAGRTVGPGDDLQAALRDAVPGAKIAVTGVHRGPFAVETPLELRGDATLESERGPVLRLRADALVEGLVIRGVAPPGAYAADAVEVAGGRVVLDRCTLSSDGPGNLVPGRALSVSGRAEVELRGCTVEDSGIGVAVDVSWSGFPTETARGARVRVHGGRFARVGTGVAAAGEDREVVLSGVAFEQVGDRALAPQAGARVVADDCTLPSGGSR